MSFLHEVANSFNANIKSIKTSDPCSGSICHALLKSLRFCPFIYLFLSSSHFPLFLTFSLCLISRYFSLSLFVSFPFISLFLSLSHFPLSISFSLCLISLYLFLSCFVSFPFIYLFLSLSHFPLILSFSLCLISL